MRRAIELARLSEGLTRPNPPVGAVVVKRGCVIGAGRHRRAGLAHAEVNAFDACTESAAGATLYVTLEPCSTTGRQPPCTERILRERVARVVVACDDPNPRHAGRAYGLLRENGIEVVTGVCRDEALPLIEPFAKHVTTGRPFVTLKLAMTLDGRIADRQRSSKWITGEEARAEVQEMRRRADAVLVGAGTIVADNPSLLYRETCAREPDAGSKLLRVIVDTHGELPADTHVLKDDAAARTIVARLEGKPSPPCGAARVWDFPPPDDGRFPIEALLTRLAKEENAMSVLCEGGGHLAAQLHEQALVDEYALFYAPLILGDASALSGFAGTGFRLADAPRLNCLETRRLGDDLLLRLRTALPDRKASL